MSDEQKMPERVFVYPETGDAPIRIWGHIGDHKEEWRKPTIYIRADTIKDRTVGYVSGSVQLAKEISGQLAPIPDEWKKPLPSNLTGNKK